MKFRHLSLVCILFSSVGCVGSSEDMTEVGSVSQSIVDGSVHLQCVLDGACDDLKTISGPAVVGAYVLQSNGRSNPSLVLQVQNAPAGCFSRSQPGCGSGPDMYISIGGTIRCTDALQGVKTWHYGDEPAIETVHAWEIRNLQLCQGLAGALMLGANLDITQAW